MTTFALIAVEHHIFDGVASFLGNVIINLQHRWVNDTHRQTIFDRMIKEYRVNGFTNRVATETKRHVRYTARYHGVWQVIGYPFGGVDKVSAVIIMLGNTGCNRKDIWVKDDILAREADFIDQDIITALTNLDFALIGIGLTVLIKRHDDDRCAIAHTKLGAFDELIIAFF